MPIDVSGEWILNGHPFASPYGGRIRLHLRQTGTVLSGDLVQLLNPQSGEPPPDPEATRADVDGQVIEDGTATNHIVILVRRNRADTFRAVFTGVLSPAQDSVAGTFTNTARLGGTFVMTKQPEG